MKSNFNFIFIISSHPPDLCMQYVGSPCFVFSRFISPTLDSGKETSEIVSELTDTCHPIPVTGGVNSPRPYGLKQDPQHLLSPGHPMSPHPFHPPEPHPLQSHHHSQHHPIMYHAPPPDSQFCFNQADIHLYGANDRGRPQAHTPTNHQPGGKSGDLLLMWPHSPPALAFPLCLASSWLHLACHSLMRSLIG